jgi:hypothetical protein
MCWITLHLARQWFSDLPAGVVAAHPQGTQLRRASPNLA